MVYCEYNRQAGITKIVADVDEDYDDNDDEDDDGDDSKVPVIRTVNLHL